MNIYRHEMLAFNRLRIYISRTPIGHISFYLFIKNNERHEQIKNNEQSTVVIHGARSRGTAIDSSH
jgi:hypothetical protein